LQILQEQSAEQAGEHPHGQEEVRAAGNPPGAIGLSPGVEYGKEADFSS